MADPEVPSADVTGCEAAHRRLLAFLDDQVAANEIDPTAPSLLPGWSVGHVLTHLARNADAMRFMIEGAEIGETRSMYPSIEHRESDIVAGAVRPAEVLVDDIRRSAASLEHAWSRLGREGWNGHGLAAFGSVPMVEVPFRRWREVEVHQSDLGLPGFTPAEWSTDFVSSDLIRLAEAGTVVPADRAELEPWRQLAKLHNRAEG